MTAHIAKPFINVADSNGNPIVAAKLYVYEVGTTTLASIYSDAALSVSITNPLSGANASDASGNFPRVYIASGTYKLRAETSDGTLIWQYDNIDTSLTSGSGALAISAGGTSATTAAAARTALGAASQTSVDDLSTDVATLTSSLANIVSVPQGRLTLTSATPVIASDVSAATSVYYTPRSGNLIPIYDGSQFTPTQFSELTLTLNANHIASTIYDCFVFSDSGTLRIVTGPAWNSSTAGSCSRGSGAATTEIELTNGLWTNANDMTARNGATTYSVTANRGTYVGSIFMDGSNGQITCHASWGQSRKFGVWNAYNRVPIILHAGDSTATWAYSTGTQRASNNDSANKVTVFAGLAEELFDLSVIQSILAAGGNGVTAFAYLGVGVNSTTAVSGTVGYGGSGGSAGGNYSTQHSLKGSHILTPRIGINNIQSVEQAIVSGGGTVTWSGTESYMQLSARWRG